MVRHGCRAGTRWLFTPTLTGDLHPMPQPGFSHVRRAAALFRKTLSPAALDEIARGCRFVQRQRTVTACSVFWALMTTLGAHPTQYISDVLRSLNAQQGWSLRYKPFWDRLAKRAFSVFMKTLFERLCREMTMRVLGAQVGSSTIDRRGCRWARRGPAVDGGVDESKTMRVIASLSPEGPRQRGRGG
jgi:hypothetical protein